MATVATKKASKSKKAAAHKHTMPATQPIVKAKIAAAPSKTKKTAASKAVKLLNEESKEKGGRKNSLPSRSTSRKKVPMADKKTSDLEKLALDNPIPRETRPII